MAKQINQYTKIRTESTVQLADLLDFDSTDDVGLTYESARITVKEFRDYLRNSIPTLYSQDGSLGANRTVDLGTNTLGFIDGNVGIGTATPSELLEVDGNQRINGSFVQNAAVNGNNNILDYITHIKKYVAVGGDFIGGSIPATGDGTVVLNTEAGRSPFVTWVDETTRSLKGFLGRAESAGQQLATTAAGDFFWRLDGSANLLFGTASTERMRISSAGNVGIGTATPTAKLNVETSTSAGANNALLVSNNITDLFTIKDDGNSLFSGTIAQGSTISSSYNNIDKSVNLNNRLRVGGIFTTDAPASGKGSISLDTTGTNRGRIIWSAGATLDGFLGVAESAGGGVGDAAAGDSFWRTESKDLFFNTGSGITTSALTIKGNNGNVGLGITTPTEKLDVVGNANVSGTYNVGGVAGFTGTGAYTNFTIVGGIITAAS